VSLIAKIVLLHSRSMYLHVTVCCPQFLLVDLCVVMLNQHLGCFNRMESNICFVIGLLVDHHLLIESHVAQDKNDNKQDFSLAKSKKMHCIRSCSTTSYGEWINSRVSLTPPPMDRRGNADDDLSRYLLGAVMGAQCPTAD
jgi:hypothetical protein